MPDSLLVLAHWSGNPYGHVGMVQSVEEVGNGIFELRVNESNWYLDQQITTDVRYRYDKNQMRLQREYTPVGLRTGTKNSALGSTQYYVRGFVYRSDATPTDKFLTYISPDTTKIYWIQNSKKYHVTDENVLNTMQNATMPGWNWSSVYTVSTSYTQAPEFISSGSVSDGLLIRQTDTSAVYMIENGKRRWLKSLDALDWMGANWDPEIIEVPPAIISNYVPNRGNDIYAVGEGEPDATIKNNFKNAYTTNANDSNCPKPSLWKGWPGTFSNCLRFPIGQVGTASASGFSGISGKYQKFGSDSSEYGTLNYSSKGTYAVYGAVYIKYKELGYSGSQLGFPISNEVSWGSYRRSNFEGGYIYWNPSNDQTYVVYNDTTPPNVTITSPTSSSTYATSSSSLNIGGSASDNVEVTQVTWSNNRGGSGTCSGTTSWSKTGISLYSGQNIITVTVRDAAGNSSTDTLTVTYTPADTTNPSVAITSPTTSSAYATSSSFLNIGGSASDNVEVTQVTWSNNRGGSGTCSGTTSWSKTGISLYSGQNTITVTVRDVAGNTGTDTLTVTYTAPDAAPPDTSIIDGSSGSITYNDVAFTYIGSDNVTSTSNLVYSYKLEGYDSNWSNFTFSTSKNYYDLPNGSYTFYVKAKDQAGNIDSFPASRSFTVVIKGDINGDGNVDLADAILALQVATLVEPYLTVYKEADVNGDGKIDLREAIYALQVVAGIRSPSAP